MKDARKRKLKRAGWKVGSASEFLELSAEESAFVELKLLLADALHTQRTHRGMTQQQLADLVGSSQSRVAKMEAAEGDVSVELLIKSLLRLGVSRQELGRLIGSKNVAA